MSYHPTAAIFHVANQMLNAIYLLFYPFIYALLMAKHYTAALRAHGSDTHGGIYIHAASVGEVNAVRSLVHELARRHPMTKIVITTTTITGLQLAKGIADQVKAYLCVLDVQLLRRAQMKKINPGLILIVETEIWFNMLNYAMQADIPVLFVNARLSEKSLSRYRFLKPLLSYLQRPIKAIITQSDADQKRFADLFEVPVQNGGNIKYSLSLPDYNALEQRKKWGFAEEDFIICFGSSRPGEEALLMSILPGLFDVISHLKIILAPRHPKRINEVLQIMQGREVLKLSGLDRASPQRFELFLIDKLGFLDQAYSICDVSIVGGSFYDFGGHNPLEPAFYSKPVIMGKYHHSCHDSVRKLQQRDAIIICGKENLEENLIRLYKNADLRTSMGQNAKSILTDNASALDDHLRGIEEWIT